MKIRQATVLDVQAITDMWAALIEEVHLYAREANQIEKERFFLSMIGKVKLPTHCVIVVEVDDEIVGFASGFLHHYEYGTSKLIGTCDNIYLEQEYRNAGLLDDMLNWLMNYGKSYGMKEMEFLTVYDTTLAKLWERKGFKPVQITYSKICQ